MQNSMVPILTILLVNLISPSPSFAAYPPTCQDKTPPICPDHTSPLCIKTSTIHAFKACIARIKKFLRDHKTILDAEKKKCEVRIKHLENVLKLNRDLANADLMIVKKTYNASMSRNFWIGFFVGMGSTLLIGSTVVVIVAIVATHK